MKKIITKGKHDGLIAIIFLVSAFLPVRYYSGKIEDVWFEFYTRIALFSFSLGFAISSCKQPESHNKAIGFIIFTLLLLAVAIEFFAI